jgi:hypothetical protein
MSTVPEAIVATHAGLRILGISVLSNLNLPDAMAPIAIEDIIATVAGAESRWRTCWRYRSFLSPGQSFFFRGPLGFLAAWAGSAAGAGGDAAFGKAGGADGWGAGAPGGSMT